MNIKKIVLRTVPYVCIALYGTKIGQAWRLAGGTAFAEKFLHWGDGFMQALASPLPSFHPQDVLAGMAIAAVFYAAVYVKGKNAKKFRHNVEYGSARWGTAKDIEPYVDPTFANNIILTQTERLTMNSPHSAHPSAHRASSPSCAPHTWRLPRETNVRSSSPR